jgi:hypothetical protein
MVGNTQIIAIIMRKLTKEQKQMMDRAIKFAPARQIFMLVWWEIFCHRKADKLIKCVEVGMTWFAAYTIANNTNNYEYRK